MSWFISLLLGGSFLQNGGNEGVSTDHLCYASATIDLFGTTHSLGVIASQLEAGKGRG
jgi:hypothetical protein